MNYFTLSNGVKIPAVGTGTDKFGREDPNRYDSPLTGDYSEMDSVLEAGYRMFDSALAYGNQAGLGDKLKSCGIPRSDLFIISKIPNRAPYNESPANIRAAVDQCLNEFKTDYLDLFLIHKAVDTALEKQGITEMNVELTAALWNTLVELYKEGKFRSVGVSNFTATHMSQLLENTDFVPMVNEVRCNPSYPNEEAIAYCQERRIQIIAHSPLSFSVAPGVYDVNDGVKAKLAEIGAKYGKSWAQVQLRYNYQHGIVSIPRSSKPKNQAASLDIFDFGLTAEEMELLKP